MGVTTKADLLKLLRDARFALVSDYVQAGGDQEAKGNPLLRSRRKLIDRIDKALVRAEEPPHAQ